MNTEEEQRIIKDISNFKNANYGKDNQEFQVIANNWEVQVLMLRALRAILIRLGS